MLQWDDSVPCLSKKGGLLEGRPEECRLSAPCRGGSIEELPVGSKQFIASIILSYISVIQEDFLEGVISRPQIKMWIHFLIQKIFVLLYSTFPTFYSLKNHCSYILGLFTGLMAKQSKKIMIHMHTYLLQKNSLERS